MSMKDTMAPLFSIVVPVYNTAEYIEQCVRSILLQDFTFFELILVDDGSTDGSSILCDEFATKDARVKVVHQENSGVSVARNRGLDVAIGRYVWFCDSDDWIEPGALGIIESVIADRSPAAICLSINRIGADGRVIGTFEAPRESTSPSDGPLQCNNYLFAHSQVYLRTLGEGLRFKEGLALLEDRDYFYKIFWLAAGNTACIAEPLYNYRVERADSAVHDISVDKALGAFRVSKEIFENELTKGFLSPAYENMVTFALMAFSALGETEGYSARYKHLARLASENDHSSLLLSSKRARLYIAVRHPHVFISIVRVRSALKPFFKKLQNNRSRG